MTMSEEGIECQFIPITTCECQFLRTAENYVKNKLWDDQFQSVYYKVVEPITKSLYFEYE